MNWSIEFSPVLPQAIAIALVVLGLVLVALSLLSRSPGGLLRLATWAVLSLALFNPQIASEQREPLSDIAVLVVDHSQSQEIGKRLDRTAETEANLRAQANALDNTELRVVTATSGIGTGEDGTRLFEALSDIAGDIPPERFAGAIMLTDGQVHDVPADKQAYGHSGPVHGLITGERHENDRRIAIESAPRFAIVGENQMVRFRIDQTGTVQGARILDVELSVDGKPVATIPAPVGVTTEFPLDITHGGPNIVELAIPAFENELSLQNNRAVAVVQGVRDRLRVLLVSGKPHPGERTWRNLLKADASVDLVHFTILRPPEKQDGTPIRELSLIAFPTRELFVEKLDEFDLIIFDRYQRRGVLPLAYMANIAQYVEHGGAVLVAAGPDYASPLSIYRTPLSSVLAAGPTGDVTITPFKPRITELGQRHPVTRGLPGGAGADPAWGRWFRLIDTTIDDGTVVMSGPEDKPLLLLNRKGEGRIAELLSDHAWLWARGYDGGGPQAELLRRLAHWLMKEPELEEEALLGRQHSRQLIVERRTMAETADPVTVTSPSGKTSELALQQTVPGVWEARTGVTEAGIYKLQDGTLTAVAAIGSPDPRETADIHSTTARLAPIAEATGGSVRYLANAVGNGMSVPRLIKVKPGRAMAGTGWLGLAANGAYRVTAVETVPLFGTLLSLAALMLLLGLMWHREGR